MFALISSFLFLFAEGAAAPKSALMRTYDEYFNIPGFEAWKFLNLAIFVVILVYLLKKPLGAAFKAKRDAIRAELIRAEEEKQAALVKLTAAEAKLAQLETEKERELKEAKAEAETEKNRIAEHAATEAARLRKQAEAELNRVQGQMRIELRRFSADESIRLAEEKLRAAIDSGTDARLIKANIQEIGGLN